MHLLLPLLAAIVFALGSMVFKRAYAEGAGVAHAVVVNNVLVGLLFVPLALWDPKPIEWALWHRPVLTATGFAVGHLLSCLAIRVGDVSVATPLLGVKVTFVAFLAAAVFGWPVTARQWGAVALTTAGVFVMGVTDLKPGRRTGITTLLALGCAACFAFTDVTIQMWAGDFGILNFLSLQFAALAVLSALMLPFFGKGALRATPSAWKWIAVAAVFSAAQAILITLSIGIWRDAAGVNVIYATRGLWSVVLVWGMGHWIGNVEGASAGNRTMWLRLIGASLVLAAVFLASKTPAA